MNRRGFMKGLFAGVATMAAPGFAIAASSFSPDESLTVKFMQSRGLDRFLLLNKTTGQMKAIDKGEVLFELPALVGRIKGDFARASLGATPAGVFELDPQGTTLDPYIVYKKVGNSSYAIHPTYQVSGEMRDERLKSKKGSERKISSGCINLSEDNFWKVMDVALGPKQNYRDLDGVSRTSNVLVVLPEQSTARQFFRIPADITP